MKLTRLIVLMGLAAIFMPSPPPGDPLLQTTARGDRMAPSRANPAELAHAAVAAASDAGSFCHRQPQACEIAGRFWNDFTVRLRYTLRLAYQWATGQESQVAPSFTPAAPAAESLAMPTAARGMHELKSQPARAFHQQVRPRPVNPVNEGGIHRGARGNATDTLITGSTRPASGSRAPALRMAQRRSRERPEGSENTLTIEDILIPWNGPQQG